MAVDDWPEPATPRDQLEVPREERLLREQVALLVNLRAEKAELVETLSRSIALLNASVSEASALLFRIDQFFHELRGMGISIENLARGDENK